MSSEARPVHMLFFPFMAAGHMPAMVDMAKLFAAHGAKATVLTTPANAALLRPTIDRFNHSLTLPHHHPISLLLVPFPSAAIGLPDGCESSSSALTQPLKAKFLKGVELLRQPFDHVLTDLRPDCVVTDIFLPWTLDVAAEHAIPRLVFHGMSYFALCAIHSLDTHKPLDSLPPDAVSFVIPGLPHKIEILTSHIAEHRRSESTNPFVELFVRGKEAESRSYGVVVNSFYELEPDYADHYRKVVGKKAWSVGPVALCNKAGDDMLERGNKAAIDGEACIKWLDGKRTRSVVYVCFGSWGEFTVAQLREMAIGLEASGYPFIWVMRDGGHEWMPEGFEERNEGKGLLIRGWAPQMLILNHPAVGGFVTHCGWNSSLEAVAAGVPMVTWPLYGDQFYNERLMVEVLGIGMVVGVKVCSARAEERAVVAAEEVEAAVARLMGGGEEAEERRKRARELGMMAKGAVHVSGSSSRDIKNLIAELMEKRSLTADAT